MSALINLTVKNIIVSQLNPFPLFYDLRIPSHLVFLIYCTFCSRRHPVRQRVRERGSLLQPRGRSLQLQGRRFQGVRRQRPGGQRREGEQL